MSPHGVCQLMASIIEEPGWYKDHGTPKRTIDCGINTVKHSVEQSILLFFYSAQSIKASFAKGFYKIFNEPVFQLNLDVLM